MLTFFRDMCRRYVLAHVLVRARMCVFRYCRYLQERSERVAFLHTGNKTARIDELNQVCDERHVMA